MGRWRRGGGLLRFGGGRVRGSRGSGAGRLAVLGFWGGREEVVVVVVDGVADGLAPGVGAESVDVFVLGDVNGLQESLRQVGDGAGSSGFYIPADNGRDEASPGGAEVAGRGGVAAVEVREVFAGVCRGG